MMTTCEFLQACRYILNILYGGFIFRIGCLGEKKHATCTIFSAFCTKPNDPLCSKRPPQSLYINLFHSPKWSSHLPQLSLFRKKEYVSQHTMRVSTCIFHVQIAESRPLVINNDLSHLGGYIYSIGLVKAVSESLQELVRASSSSMLVTLKNV